MSRWFRHYAGMMRDDKLVSVAIRSKQSIERVVWVWGAILESAAEIDDNGRFDVDTAEIAYFLRADEADILAVVAGLEASGRCSAGVVVKWGARQFQSDRSASRQAAYRERKRSENRASDSEQTSGDAGVTSLSRHGDAPETETETETETEEEVTPLPPKGAEVHLPEWLPKDEWAGFRSMRQKIKKPLTPRAAVMIIRTLGKLRETGEDPAAVLDQSTLHCWQDLYAVKAKTQEVAGAIRV